MADAQQGTTFSSVFDMDPHGEIDTEQLAAMQAQDDQPEQRASESDGEPAPDQAFQPEKPEDLPAELEARWEQERRKHQRNYSKAIERLNRDREQLSAYQQKAALVDKFYSDPQYAAQTIAQMAQQLGYSLTPMQGATGRPAGTQAPTSDGNMPAWVMEAANAAVADQQDLAFLAPVIAKASWAIAQQTTQPLQAEAEQRKVQEAERERAARNEEFRRMETELEQDGIDWREHEEEMTERLEFLQNAIAGKGAWIHPKYGNFLRFLHTWTTGNQAAAQAEAGKRLQKALQNRTSTGQASRSPGVDTNQLIKNAKTDQERWALAFRSAFSEVQQNMRR